MYQTDSEARQKLAICKYVLCQAGSCVKWEWEEEQLLEIKEATVEEIKAYIMNGWEIIREFYRGGLLLRRKRGRCSLTYPSPTTSEKH